MQQNQIEHSYLQMVEISQAAELMGKTIKGLLREGAAGQRLLYIAVAPDEATLVALPSNEAPKIIKHSTRRTRFVVLSEEYCVELAVHGSVEIQHWPAALDDKGLFAWHWWKLKEPQKLGLSMVYVHEHDVSSPGAAAGMSETERDKLLRQIGGLALVLAEKYGTYRRGDKPNASQIAKTVDEIFESLPDANTHGAGDTNLRTSIAEGLKLLRK